MMKGFDIIWWRHFYPNDDDIDIIQMIKTLISIIQMMKEFDII
jgi:hypothetical protein